ncbi:hypothetical protein [Cupriavidus sp. TMH.W2]|uniref:hypothetical protein n=1 Tax=Cupriavidus sp. TMH.W2 TaxID=3434465 RepID=UPI003D778172
MHDVFEPKREPARSIYNAFQNEAAKRKGRRVEEWMDAECDAVFRESVHQASKLGLRVPSRDEVVRAERYAMGSVDYGAKWAHGIVEAMKAAPRAPSLSEDQGKCSQTKSGSAR